MTSIGLHLTKCAGTSLMSSIRRRLTEDEYILISSFYENALASRADIWDVADYKRILFVFGHYIHESLFKLFSPRSIWDIYLFTGVREPISRAISQFYQLKKVTGREPDILYFTDEYGSSMCDEIIRAFPSMVNQNQGAPKWLQAAEILTCFDYIYSTERYSETIGPIYESIGLGSSCLESTMARDNVRNDDLDSNIVEQLSNSMKASDDTRLYNLIGSAIGQKNAGNIIANKLHIPGKREELLAPACQAQENSDRGFNSEFFYDMMGYELHLLGDDKKDRVLTLLEKKRDQTDELIKFLKKRIY